MRDAGIRSSVPRWLACLASRQFAVECRCPSVDRLKQALSGSPSQVAFQALLFVEQVLSDLLSLLGAEHGGATVIAGSHTGTGLAHIIPENSVKQATAFSRRRRMRVHRKPYPSCYRHEFESPPAVSVTRPTTRLLCDAKNKALLRAKHLGSFAMRRSFCSLP